MLARKYVSDKVTDEVLINGNHKRQYWNLNDTNESIGIVLNFLGSESTWENNMPSLMCFAWCNADMLDSAPTRSIINSPHVHSTTGILQSLVNHLKISQQLPDKYIILQKSNYSLCAKPPDKNQDIGQDLRYTFLYSSWHTDAKKIPEKLIYRRHLA